MYIIFKNVNNKISIQINTFIIKCIEKLLNSIIIYILITDLVLLHDYELD